MTTHPASPVAAPAAVLPISGLRARTAAIREQATARSAAGYAVEALVAFTAALILPISVRHLRLDPLDRIGQVSGLAALQLRFALVGIVLVAMLMAALRLRGSRHFPLVVRLSAAAAAGLASGFVAGGAVISLLGTPWPMFGLNGDSGRIVEWSSLVAHGHSVPPEALVYPPGPLYTLGYYAEWFRGGNTAYAFKDLQILGAAVTGPLAYLCWRLVLSPVRALAFGVLPAFAIIDAYKPYSATVLIMLVPVLAAMVRELSKSATQRWTPVLVKGAAFGVVLGVLFLTYSGWFVWSAAGVIAAAAIFFPWRTGLLKGAGFLGATVAAFVVVAGSYAVTLLQQSATTVDKNFSFDTKTDPAYFLMWRTDMPGKVGQWPVPGELGGIGLFAIVLFVCLGVCLWLGMRKPFVVTVVCMFASAWVMRMYFASEMYSTQTVQLWLRTDNQLLYCALILGGLAVHLVVRELTARGKFPSPQTAVIGAFVGLLFLFGSVASSMSDRYMPAKENSYKILPWVSHTVRELNGKCPTYAPNHTCSQDGDQTWQQLIQ
ncbi:hypothetical protein P3T37_005997 [Kitasatospora sp. MAA4]|uniref:hypothetical protein n=1 Tax=Kitasatospora sp. MAA4 TaxID=3035093 RepID=UPI0024770E1D|nr:hypothetical protein [Kitasatospora sp. MAA4]MDH6136569.1 hypothetical protein [Kitasatospora sp. MAA4]